MQSQKKFLDRISKPAVAQDHMTGAAMCLHPARPAGWRPMMYRGRIVTNMDLADYLEACRSAARRAVWRTTLSLKKNAGANRRVTRRRNRMTKPP